MRTEMSITSLNQAPTVRAVALLGNPGRTGWTRAKNVHDVLWVTKTMVGGDFFGPRLHSRGFDFCCGSTPSTNQVVMVPW